MEVLMYKQKGIFPHSQHGKTGLTFDKHSPLTYIVNVYTA